MKATVAFFGIPRCSRICAPAIEQNLLAPLRKKASVSVVYHLYAQNLITNPRSNENLPLTSDNYDYFTQFKGILDSPDMVATAESFKTWKDFGDAFDDNFVSLRNLRAQLLSLAKVTMLVEGTSPDVVIFARPDLLYHNPLSDRQVQFVAEHQRSCIIPDWQWWDGYNDRFAICGSSSFWDYGLRIRHALELCHQLKTSVHAERLLKFALRHARADVYITRLQASRVRVNGQKVNENFTAKDTVSGGRMRRAELELRTLISKRLGLL